MTAIGDVREKEKLTGQNTLAAMEANGVKRIVFTSSVAVYGLNKKNPDEEHPKDPFNHYGKSKWLAEMELEKWYREHPDWNINILRPTVIFGERNRGNVYNLLRQISEIINRKSHYRETQDLPLRGRERCVRFEGGYVSSGAMIWIGPSMKER